MDPDENLSELRELAAALVEADFDTLDATDVNRLCELSLALDAWLTAGGFLPKRWSKKR